MGAGVKNACDRFVHRLFMLSHRKSLPAKSSQIQCGAHQTQAPLQAVIRAVHIPKDRV